MRGIRNDLGKEMYGDEEWKRMQTNGRQDWKMYGVLIQAVALTRTQTLTSRQDWACEASFQIYPLYPAIMRYCIDTLILDPNVLRDSILVRSEMTTYECYVSHLRPTTKIHLPIHNPTKSISIQHL